MAPDKENENTRFRQFLKTRCNLEADEIDQRVFETARRSLRWNRLHYLRQLLPGDEADIQ